MTWGQRILDKVRLGLNATHQPGDYSFVSQNFTHTPLRHLHRQRSGMRMTIHASAKPSFPFRPGPGPWPPQGVFGCWMTSDAPPARPPARLGSQTVAALVGPCPARPGRPCCINLHAIAAPPSVQTVERCAHKESRLVRLPQAHALPAAAAAGPLTAAAAGYAPRLATAGGIRWDRTRDPAVLLHRSACTCHPAVCAESGAACA